MPLKGYKQTQIHKDNIAKGNKGKKKPKKNKIETKEEPNEKTVL